MSLNRPKVLADPGRYEAVAQRIFEIAIAEGRCAELLLSLFAGAGCTISPRGELRVWWPTTGKEEVGEREYETEAAIGTEVAR